MASDTISHPREHQSYITLHSFRSEKGDPGGFGFGGANGVTGGFGVGGVGPQPGLEPRRQAHYRRQANPGADATEQNDESRVRTDAKVLGDHDYPTWLDGFPHTFHGWGPNAPDFGRHSNEDSEKPDSKEPAPIGNLELALAPETNPYATSLIWKTRG